MSARRDELQDQRKVYRGPIIAGLVVIVVVLLALVGLMAGRLFFGNEEEPTVEPTTATTQPPSTKPLVREDLNVVVGEGGTATSKADPSVPVGYEPTCKGAVEAATNYLVALNYTRASSGQVTTEQFVELTREVTTGDYQTSAVENTQEMFDQYDGPVTALGSTNPDWGGFTVDECTEGESATVTIISASDYVGDGNFYYTSHSTMLTWTDDDWKISDSEPGETPVTLPTGPTTTPDEQVYTLIGTHTQWESYEAAK